MIGVFIFTIVFVFIALLVGFLVLIRKRKTDIPFETNIFVENLMSKYTSHGYRFGWELANIPKDNGRWYCIFRPIDSATGTIRNPESIIIEKGCRRIIGTHGEGKTFVRYYSPDKSDYEPENLTESDKETVEEIIGLANYRNMMDKIDSNIKHTNIKLIDNITHKAQEKIMENQNKYIEELTKRRIELEQGIRKKTSKNK